MSEQHWSRMHFGICPKCGLDKFIGHGPLCADCYLAAGSEPPAGLEDERIAGTRCANPACGKQLPPEPPEVVVFCCAWCYGATL